MLATLLPMLTKFKLLQFRKAFSPIAVVLVGMVTVVKPEQPENALSVIFVTVSVNVTSFNDFRLANHEPTLGQFSVTVLKDLQPSNADS